MSVKNYAVDFGGAHYVFGDDGFLRSASIDGFNGAVYPATAGDFGRIRIRFSDGRALIPFCCDEPVRTECERGLVLEFPYIHWKFEDGTPYDGFRMSLRYELMSAGRAFVNAFFVAADMHSPDLDEFSLNFDFASGDFESARWAVVPRPKNVDASMIQTMRSGRNLPPGENRRIESEILPDVGINLRDKSGETAYFEVFVEGENAISGDNGDVATDFRWNEHGDLHASFEFVKNKPCKNKLMQLWQWRNQWGWILKTADKKRQKPPFHMHHYFDNYQHYPTDECIENLARSGTDVLIIHENWRFDLQNDGVPHDLKELRRVIAKAHELGIRIALYIRGNEVSALDDACPWFDRYLKKDFDGLYMDYGGPFHESIPDEAYPGGRVPIKNYLLRMESLRKRIGRDGIFYGHMGTCYCGIWYASGMIDGYVSGEGEGGVMVRSRQDHEYFSMAVVSTGTMWTGAFPAYSTGKMRPFVAAAGQYPHSSLGEQFLTSSLAHPREPGINDRAFKPIWKLWRFFRNERDVSVLNDYNSSGVFSAADNVGHYLMVSNDRKRALLIVSNFSETVNRFSCKLNPELCGFSPDGMMAYRFSPTEDAPGKAVKVDASTLNFDFELGKWDVAAILFESDVLLLPDEIADFEKPYPALSAENHRYLDKLARQKKYREEPVPAKEIYLSLSVPNTNLSYEYSLCYDLYFNSMALVEFFPDGTRKRVGWISQKGFVPEEPPADDYIWPDVVSPKVALHKIFGKGIHHIGIESVHYGAPFYSFLYAHLEQDQAEPFTIEFMNELEPNREFLRWKINLI